MQNAQIQIVLGMRNYHPFFALHLCNDSISGQWRPRSDCASWSELRSPPMHEVMFSHYAAKLCFFSLQKIIYFRYPYASPLWDYYNEYLQHILWRNRKYVLIFDPGHIISYKIAFAPSEDADKPAHTCNLITLIAVRFKTPWMLGYPEYSAKTLIWA